MLMFFVLWFLVGLGALVVLALFWRKPVALFFSERCGPLRAWPTLVVVVLWLVILPARCALFWLAPYGAGRGGRPAILRRLVDFVEFGDGI